MVFCRVENSAVQRHGLVETWPLMFTVAAEICWPKSGFDSPPIGSASTVSRGHVCMEEDGREKLRSGRKNERSRGCSLLPMSSNCTWDCTGRRRDGGISVGGKHDTRLCPLFVHLVSVSTIPTATVVAAPGQPPRPLLHLINLI